MNKNNVNFIGIGAQKAGTSWIFRNLKFLPDFTLLPFKEIHYFDRSIKYRSSSSLLTESYLVKRIANYSYLKKVKRKVKNENSLNTINRQTFLWMLRFFSAHYNDNWYLSLFKKKGITGEFSPSYAMLDKDDIEKMHRLCPDVKLIFILRNPIDRAWSHYRFVKKPDKTKAPPSNAKILKFLKSEQQLLRSDYLGTLERYLSFFKPEQICLGFYDAIQENPQELMQQIVSFIGGDSKNILDKVDLKKRVNESQRMDIPLEILTYLQEYYYNDIKSLSNIYGNYCTNWLNEIEGNQDRNSTENKPTVMAQNNIYKKR
jgi:hypothetical protein